MFSNLSAEFLAVIALMYNIQIHYIQRPKLGLTLDRPYCRLVRFIIICIKHHIWSSGSMSYLIIEDSNVPGKPVVTKCGRLSYTFTHSIINLVIKRVHARTRA